MGQKNVFFSFDFRILLTFIFRVLYMLLVFLHDS